MNNNNHPQNNKYNPNGTRQTPGLQNGQPQRPRGQYQPRPVNPHSNSYPPVRHKSRSQVRRAAILAVICAVIAVLLVATLVIFVGRIFSGNMGNDGNSHSDGVASDNDGDSKNPDKNNAPDSGTNNQPSSDTQTSTTNPSGTPDADPYEYLEMSEADVHKGYQILINYEHAYTFDADFELKPLYGNKNTSYGVPNRFISFDTYAMSWLNKMMEAMAADIGNSFAFVNSAHRTLEDQEGIYANQLDKYGEEYAKMHVAIPGHSEHHSGLAVDLGVYTSDGYKYTFDNKPEYPEWLINNGYKYGFVQRYTADKVDITKIAYENWHYRYVGKPHAFYMVKNNLCFEEYIDLLRKEYKFDNKTLKITDDEGASWEIYFVPSSLSGTTRVPVPADKNYEVSGNNVDGFIVTCQG